MLSNIQKYEKTFSNETSVKIFRSIENIETKPSFHMYLSPKDSATLLPFLVIQQGRPGFLGIRYPGLFNNEYTVSFIRIFEYRYTGF